jgi:hypothetical protein
MLFFDSRALQTWQVGGRVRGLCYGLVLIDVQIARSLARSLVIHQSINQSPAKEEKRQWECDTMPDGRLINTTTGHARGVWRAQHTTCDSIDKLHDTGHAMLESDRYVTHRQFDAGQGDTRPGD